MRIVRFLPAVLAAVTDVVTAAMVRAAQAHSSVQCRLVPKLLHASRAIRVGSSYHIKSSIMNVLILPLGECHHVE